MAVLSYDCVNFLYRTYSACLCILKPFTEILCVPNDGVSNDLLADVLSKSLRSKSNIRNKSLVDIRKLIILIIRMIFWDIYMLICADCNKPMIDSCN